MAYNPSLMSAPAGSSPFKPYPKIWYTTPQMYGAVGDGVTDDTAALQAWMTGLGTGYWETSITGTRAGFLPAGIGAVVAGGGANIVPVFCDGTDWRIG